ncbi:MAG: hypothetical protein EOS63_02485 [Mesorhizobium sp.]|uniref:hypothetical protein n=1 Tax=Mesorhizobium sp. TaxID=1871066 RepID=UPI000FE6436F|nr:hypothetical protein [Mesorhizobium sp.]RWE84912.1 MAG: hypothetical protein EOS63_02485 [Mesorhizobium sp.]TIT14436.1 MAG: hypothetical protein E5W74_02600 [Mesorhizobium sp.]TJW64785.1 MAG: hypothetical protein E5V97_05430 [Mesorhizobium sp.]
MMVEYWEEVYLVSGDIIAGGSSAEDPSVSFGAKTYACRAGIYHGPFRSQTGCLLFELHYYDEA